MPAIKERRNEIRKQIQRYLPDLDILDIFWTDSTCPECKDDCCFYFVIDKVWRKVDEKSYQAGGYICLDCGWSNAGAIHTSDLPEGYDATYDKN
jgi:hypothetical protein